MGQGASGGAAAAPSDRAIGKRIGAGPPCPTWLQSSHDVAVNIARPWCVVAQLLDLDSC